MPILLPIIFDNEFKFDLNEKRFDTEKDKERYKSDLKAKQKLLNTLTKDCLISIKMSEVK